jgi:hypothetical protein
VFCLLLLLVKCRGALDTWGWPQNDETACFLYVTSKYCKFLVSFPCTSAFWILTLKKNYFIIFSG